MEDASHHLLPPHPWWGGWTPGMGPGWDPFQDLSCLRVPNWTLPNHPTPIWGLVGTQIWGPKLGWDPKIDPRMVAGGQKVSKSTLRRPLEANLGPGKASGGQIWPPTERKTSKSTLFWPWEVKNRPREVKNRPQTTLPVEGGVAVLLNNILLGGIFWVEKCRFTHHPPGQM